MKKISRANLILLLLGFFMPSCVKDKIELVRFAKITGNLQINTLAGNLRPAPAGTTVIVKFEKEVDYTTSTFKTTEEGKYSFSPQTKGNYTFSFAYTDSLLHFNSELVEKQDIDTTRPSSKSTIYYSATSIEIISVDKDNTTIRKDATLEGKSTSLKLLLVDENENSLSNIRVCIYTNKSFADQNSPFCGGSIAYLSSDDSGVVLFTSLQEKKYYINARGSVGLIPLTNQWSNEMKFADASNGQLISKKIILK